MSQTTDIPALVNRIEATERAAARSFYQGPAAEVARLLGLGCEELAGAQLIWNHSVPRQFFNRVVGLGVFEPATDEVIDALLERIGALGVRCWVQVSPTAQPAGLAARLEARGLRRDNEWVMYHHRLEGELPEVVVPRGYRIEQVRPEMIAAWADTQLAGWHFPPATAAAVLAMLIPLPQHPDWTCYAAIDESNDAVVAGGSFFIADGVADLHDDSTRDQYRRRGLQAALIATRLAELRRRGCSLAYAPSLPGDPVERNMLRAGFQVAYVRSNYVLSKKR